MDKVIKEEKPKNKKKGFIASLPRFVKIFYILGIVGIFLYVAYTLSEPFSDFFNSYIAAFFRTVLAYLTRLIPFSFAELLIILLPVVLVALIRFANKNYANSWRDVGLFCVSIISVLSFIFALFTVVFAPGYFGKTLDKKLGIERRDVSAEELYNTALILVEHINEESEAVVFRTKGFSIMPYTVSDMNDKLIDAYDSVCDKYDFIQKLDSTLKPVMLSEPMSYTHITGVYTFFTGEANINVNFPDYSLPFTAAHELAHQRGIAREDEANFVAYLVCIESSDPYVRYSGYLNLYEYVANALYSADAALYREVASRLSIEVRYELVAYSNFFDKYRDSVASDVSGVVNDAYLSMQGTPGSASYGMVVDLAVAYYGKDASR